MSTSTSTLTSPPRLPAKTKIKMKIVVLKLSPAALAMVGKKDSSSDTKSAVSSASTPEALLDDDQIPIKQNSSSNDNPSEAASTPAPLTDAPTPAADGAPPKKRKGPAPGFKRGPLLGPDGMPKPRGKPGPKKKPRLEDGTIDHGVTKPLPVAAGPTATKLGPRANQGAINAGLRALDRTGKACRKWNRKPFQIKSFTGVTWDVASWKAPVKPAFLNGHEDSEMNDVSLPSSSDMKRNESSHGVESNGPDPADSGMLSTPAASSPVAASHAIAANG